MMAAPVHRIQAVFLEEDFPRQLHLARVVNSRGDHTKVLAILASIRDTPNWMVEGIDCVHSQFNVERLRQWELPENRSVKVLVGLSTQRISWSVPECVLIRSYKGSRINPLARRLMLRLGIAYLIWAFVTAEEVKIARVGNVASVIDCVNTSGLQGGNPSNLPIAQHVIRYPVASRETPFSDGYLPHPTSGKHLRQVIAGHTSITLGVVGVLDAGGTNPIPSIRSEVGPLRPRVRNQVAQAGNAASTLQ